MSGRERKAWLLSCSLWLVTLFVLQTAWFRQKGCNDHFIWQTESMWINDGNICTETSKSLSSHWVSRHKKEETDRHERYFAGEIKFYILKTHLEKRLERKLTAVEEEEETSCSFFALLFAFLLKGFLLFLPFLLPFFLPFYHNLHL